MAHLNWDTLQYYRNTHKFVHDLLERYYEDQNVTEEELVRALEIIKNDTASMIEDWKNYLGYE